MYFVFLLLCNFSTLFTDSRSPYCVRYVSKDYGRLIFLNKNIKTVIHGSALLHVLLDYSGTFGTERLLNNTYQLFVCPVCIYIVRNVWAIKDSKTSLTTKD